jgi:CDP-diacylglycerol--serine O-phosphatidyltransferase
MRRKEDQPLRRRRRGMFLLPSLFTCGNIAAGFYAILQAMQGTAAEYWHFDHAAKAIGFAILFDGLDGAVARMTNTASDFGRELDSLADVLTFGVAPAVLAWMWGFRMLPPLDYHNARVRLVQIGVIASFMFLIACASRLARFNIQKNPQPSNPGRPGRKYFVGMPTPAGAGIIAATVHFSEGDPLAVWWLSGIWCALLVATAFLMVSTWRFYSFKGIDFRRRHSFGLVVLIGSIFALIYFFSEYVLFLIALTYMLSGVLLRLGYILRRHRSSPPPPAYLQAPEAQ